MLFNSYEFIFGFLPICLVGFFLLASLGWKKAASIWLSVTSLIFYCWWNPDPSQPWSPKYLLLILTSVVANYFLGVTISRAKENENHRRAKTILIIGVTANLATLAYFKYAGFLTANLNTVFGTHFALGKIALPLAISFFTFTQIAYLADSYNGLTKAYNFRWYLLFVTFFPHLIAGPIVLYRKLMPQFAQPETWRFNIDNLVAGLTLFGFGLCKKVVIADSVSPIADGVFQNIARGDIPGLIPAWLGALAYTCQLYFDFSGYSDMAIGLGRMFNVQFPVNFNSPYKAADISDFWRRWHMTLSQFLRDHLYIPLGGNRAGETRRYFNLMITMLLGGLWHGAGWTFVIWGGLHGLYLVIHQLWVKTTKDIKWTMSAPAIGAGHLLTFFAVVVGWVFFRSPTFADAAKMLKGMIGQSGFDLPLQLRGLLAGHFAVPGNWFAPLPCKAFDLVALGAALLIAFVAPNTNEIFRLGQPARENVPVPQPLWKPTVRWALVSGIVIGVAILHLSRITEFLYFQF
jgi:alginate O-acetyltransferase complex protein AlgI